MKLSIVLPVHNMKNGDFFLERLQNSLEEQTLQEYEVVVTQEDGMAKNINSGITKATGDIIKILFMDDYLASPDSLEKIVDNFKGGWLVTGCAHDKGDGVWFNEHMPSWNDEILTGKNTIGSPSVIAFENDRPILFDETMSWLLDCDLYHRMYGRYGEPTYLMEPNVIIGVGAHQTTFHMADEEKLKEHAYINNKYNV